VLWGSPLQSLHLHKTKQAEKTNWYYIHS
jgi:hypothetical protein